MLRIINELEGKAFASGERLEREIEDLGSCYEVRLRARINPFDHETIEIEVINVDGSGEFEKFYCYNLARFGDSVAII